MVDAKCVIVALDFSDAGEVLALVSGLEPNSCRLKVGKELYTHCGPALVERLVADGFDVFLDLKFHDIPNTVAGACGAAADLGVWMVNVHALGGRRMMEAAREAIAQKSHQPLLIAVTILTSMGESDLHEIGLSGSAKANVLRLAKLAEQSGLNGVVCSPLEVAVLNQQCAEEFNFITPGIRPAGAAVNDQKRITTPVDALSLGSNYLVIGRPITAAADPLAALQAINSDIQGAFNLST
ncbi:MAG: orotidine-5'-phosphate decarboxylase [Thiotrichaceae bacterium]|nr:orotidine-5'-phosphate decarboxylase [Thiotrichaceae bacterium]PCI12320.1 MAG: orotidine-5'-phosphate decarboxylase [Thiotrichales bacterium]